MRNIIDGNSLLFRAFYGVHSRLTRPDGVPVNAVFGFCNMILPLLFDAGRDDEFICVFDAERKNWRHEIYPGYKMNRVDVPDDLVRQFPIARAAAAAMGMPCLAVPGVEADDVIATLCQHSCPTRIISSDKDLMQLINPCVFMYDTMKEIEIHEGGVFEKFGVRPDQVIDCQALIGDSSDNVPGVHGVGPKKAAELLSEFGTLENLYDNLDKVKNDRVRQLLTDGRDSAFMSKKLVALKTDVDIPPYPEYSFDADAARKFFIDEVGSPVLAEKVRKLFSPQSAVNSQQSDEVFVFEEGCEGLFVGECWGKLIDPNIKKIAWDWKTIFHKLDTQGFDVSKIQPIDDVMLMNYAANKTLRGELLDDYHAFIANPAKVYEMDLAILRPLFQMEKNGVLVDVKKLNEISESLHARADELQIKIWESAGEEFNIASPKQLGEILFDKLKLPSGKKRSTDADVLTELAPVSEVARLVLEWRSITKLSGTYTDALPKSIGADGRIHTTYLQTSTNTGRLSSVNPNLQNIPIKSDIGGEIRKCFVAAPGHVLIAADYSQIQLRILADMADVRVLKDAFRDGKDIHSETALKLFGMVTPENRRIAKTINFSIIYGVSPFGLAAQLNAPVAAAAKIIEDYMGGFPEIKDYIERTKKVALAQGFVETPMGRKIFFPDINNPRLRSYSLRAAVNAPVQGYEADIMRVAVARLGELPIKMILQVHDEIVFECPVADAENYACRIKGIMEGAALISVPLVAEYSISDVWDK
ncbi:MAG: hypothetical protein LBQ49_00090 [Rickettsiales bacterium]|jgi:DNA polymerase-1|nr:hypothetical protein [Rickettsiales bacterium]